MMSNIQASVQQLTQQAFNTALVGPYNVKQFNERKRIKKAKEIDDALSKSAGKPTPGEGQKGYKEAGEIYQKMFDQNLLDPKDYPKMAEIARNAAIYRQEQKKINKAYSKLDAKERLATLKKKRGQQTVLNTERGDWYESNELKTPKHLPHTAIKEKMNDKQQSTIKSILGGI